MTRDRDDHGPEESLDERLSAWLDGEFDSASETELRAELEARPELAARLAQLRRVDDALRTLPEPVVRPELAAQLRERLAEEGQRQRPRQRAVGAAPARRRRWIVPLMAAAAAAAFALLALPRLRETPPSKEPLIARAPPAPAAPDVLEPQPRQVAPLDPAPEPDELALTMEIETETDLEVIEMLDWLETLGEIESS